MGSYQVMVDTDDDGNVVFKDIPAGKYILREVATVNGYYLTAPDIAFEVNDAINFEAHPANTPYAEPVKVTKVDNETNEPLSGAEFAVFVDSNDNGVWDKDDKKAEAWIDANKNKLIDDGELAEVGDVKEVFSNPQSKAAKKLVFPSNPFDPSDEDGELIRIVFDGTQSNVPFIANLVEQTGVKVNILSANTKSVGGIGYGQMILELPSDRKDRQTAVDFFRKNGLSVSEVN